MLQGGIDGEVWLMEGVRKVERGIVVGVWEGAVMRG